MQAYWLYYFEKTMNAKTPKTKH